jgi:integrase
VRFRAVPPSRGRRDLGPGCGGYASTLLAQGVSIKELAEYLGHTDPGFTSRTYTHLVASSFERARLAIDGVFGLKSADGLKAA